MQGFLCVCSVCGVCLCKGFGVDVPACLRLIFSTETNRDFTTLTISRIFLESPLREHGLSSLQVRGVRQEVSDMLCCVVAAKRS